MPAKPLKDAEARFQALTENAWDGVMIVDTGGIIRYHSPSVERILGYPLPEVVGRQVWEFMDPQDAARLAQEFRGLVADAGRSGRRELRLKHKDGSWRTAEGVASNLLNNPHVQGILINYQDVTARRLAEDHLIESERKYRRLVETLYEGTWSFDAEGRTVFVNSRMAEMLGYTPVEMDGKPIYDFMDKTQARLVRENMALRRQGAREKFAYEFEFLRKDGSRMFGLVATAPAWDAEGDYQGATAAVMDLSERRQAEEALRRSEAMLAEAERLAGIGSVSQDLRAAKAYRSDGLLRIFGVNRAEMTDEPEAFLRYVHEDDRDQVREALRRSMAGAAPFREDYRIRRPDGAERIVHGEGQTSLDEQGRAAHWFAWIQDITERRQLEEKVLSIGDRERRSIGHDLHDDLGQQLTGIVLLGRALQERLAAQKSMEAGAMGELLQHVEHALARVREMSRGLESVPARPEGLLDALSGLAAHARATSKVSCRFSADGPVMIRDASVANHLYRIAQEAVHNALRHGRPRNVDITLSEKDRVLSLTVADDGAGLLDSRKPRTGMGLDIMHHRASLIHGTLTIASRSGGGTEVICRVSAAPTGDQA